MKAVKKIGTIVVSVILWIVILLAALFAFTTLATRNDDSVANVLGYTPLTVQTDSMSPFFNAGDMIVIKTCDPDTLKVGDVITFHTIIQNEYALNTHRIDEIDDSQGARVYTTKGDNNLITDSHRIQNGDIVGKYVFKIAGMGKVMDFLSSSVGFLLVIVLPMLIFFIYQVYHLIMVSIQLKKATAIEAAEEAAKIQAQAAPAVDADDAAAKLAEAQAALAEAKRLQAEAEAKLAAANKAEEQAEETKE